MNVLFLVYVCDKFLIRSLVYNTYRVSWAIVITLAIVNRQLLERASNKDMANVRKDKFGDKLHLSKIISIIYVPKREQVWVFGIKRLSPLKKKCYKSCE